MKGGVNMSRLRIKTPNEAQTVVEELYKEALNAMKRYSGQSGDDI